MSAERTIPTSGRTESSPRALDRAIARLAERQHGVVALSQLDELGLGASTVRARVATGRLHRIHRGVFAVGHLLSHRAAGPLWDLRAWSGSPEVLTAGDARRRHPGIATRRSELTADKSTSVGPIPCTSPSRTLLDLPTVLHPAQLERVVERAERLRLLDLGAVKRLLARRRGCRGAARLRATLAVDDADHLLTRSRLERRFLGFCSRGRIPAPVVNGLVEVADRSLEVDFTWPDRRVAVETDGFETHRTRAAFERDRLREQLLSGAGWTTIRCTWRQVERGSAELHTAIAQALERSAPLAERTISPPLATELSSRRRGRG